MNLPLNPREPPQIMRLLFPAFFLVSAFLCQAQTSGSTLLLNGNVIDVGTGVINRHAILIEGDKIKAVGDYQQLAAQTSKTTRRIDCRGKYIIPGLWDMHVHLEGADLVEDNAALLPIFLAYGITTIRDCASDLGVQVLQWRNDINTRRRLGPTIFTAGLKLEGKNSTWKGDLEIENEEELNKMLDLLGQYQVDFVKITENTLGGDLFLKSVKAAHDRGYRVSGHVPLDLTIAELVDAGFTSVEHASYLLRLGSDDNKIKNDLASGKITRSEADASYSKFDQEVATQKYTALGQKGLFVCPTLIGGKQLAYLAENDHSKDEFMAYLTNRFVANYQWRIQRMSNESAEQRKQRQDRYLFLRAQIPIMYRSGLRIIAGSDAAALNTYVYPAEALLQELEIFQESGLKPIEILQTATMNGALYFGIEKNTGSIAPGKNADLVILDDNPLVDVRALRSVNAVIKFGNHYNRTTLDLMLEEARDTKVKLDDERK